MDSATPEPGSALAVGRDVQSAADAPRASVAIGFGSPSTDSGVTRLDLNEVLIRHAEATFMMRASGSAMRDIGIDSGDLLIVDRAISPANGHVVVAVCEGEFVCRQLVRQGRIACLRAADAAVADIVASEDQELQIWGVVTKVIRSMPV